MELGVGVRHGLGWGVPAGLGGGRDPPGDMVREPNPSWCSPGPKWLSTLPPMPVLWAEISPRAETE